MSGAVSDALDTALAQELVRHGFEGAEVALVLGSGLGAFADARLEAHGRG